ncbi:MAG: DNA/RNA nuclease SfsA [Alcanivoracaceae bacterium]|nr:DNA/RNA nuclease SfsA [Alcanivoracaceae bacterium]
MIFAPPLEQAIFLRRYKRFMVDVERADGSTITVHCPNTGSMKHCTAERAPVLISDSGNPKRKYRHTLEAVQIPPGHWVGVNTMRTNALVAEAISEGQFPQLGEPASLRREVTWDDSRFDLALQTAAGQPVFVEVKNVTLGPGPDDEDDGHIRFPDAVTERGQKHLRTLMAVAESGARAVLFFCVQHTGARTAGPADDIDPVYGRLLREAAQKGVEIMAWKTAISAEAFRLDQAVPVTL